MYAHEIQSERERERERERVYRRRMSVNKIEEVMETGRGVIQQKETLISNLNSTTSAAVDSGSGAVDSGRALQLFLDRIPISSIPGIRNSPVLELKTGDHLRDAINLLYSRNVSGAPITDVSDGDATCRRMSDRYIGFIDLASMILWALERIEKDQIDSKDVDDDEWNEESSATSLLSMLEHKTHIGQTKVGELAKSFLWDPFFPVNLDDTLFHVLLLLSKHRLLVVPVIEQSNSQVIGFVTQSAVIQLLLQSSGLEWFDSIANKAISEFQFDNEGHAPIVYEDQSVVEAAHILWETRNGAIAVINRESNRLVGMLRDSDIHLILDNTDLFSKRESLTVEHFIRLDAEKMNSDPTIERDLGALLSAGNLRLRNSFLPKMDSPVTNKVTDTLQQAMKNLAETKSNFIFLVDELQEVRGVLTLREIILQFAPPCVESRISGGGFFECALQQSGCHVESGTVICDH